MNINKKLGKDLTLNEILSVGKSLYNKTFRELYDSNKTIHKGGLGHIIEKHVFNIEPNSNPEPDFVNAAVELKVTPVRKLRNGLYSAKERLVLNIIDYDLEVYRDFIHSSFWRKNSILYILFYLYEDNKDKLDYLILKDYLLDFSENPHDLAIIKKDFEIIRNKIATGKAHEISESDTMYLAACTKGVNSESYRSQPFSTIPARQRAYSLKPSYMTQIFNRETLPRILDYLVDAIELEKKGFEQIIENKLSIYIGKSQNELKKQFNITSNSKNLNEMLVASMLGQPNTKISKTAEFKKANIVPKTIRVEEDNSIKEHMSFETFEYTKIIEETWEDSRLKEYFSTTRFMFVVFKKEKSEYIFKGVKFWNMSDYEIENFLSQVWTKTVNTIKNGLIVKKIVPSTLTYFPKPSENRIAHVRPHAKNLTDTYELPYPDKLTGKLRYMKHSFWINKSYIKEKISSLI